MEDYIHDIFVSYCRLGLEWTRWTKQNFADPLTVLMQPRLKNVSIYTDQSLEIGASWPLELARNLARSKLMVVILSRAYFYSDWCKLELGLMFEREKLTGVRTLENPSGLIIPVIIDDGESFPDDVQAIQGTSIHDFANPFISIGSPEHQALTQVLLMKVCPAIDKALPNVPTFDPEWENISHAEAKNMFRLKSQSKMKLPLINLP